MDWTFFHDLLSIDSTSGKERKVAEWLVERLPELFPVTNRPVLWVDEVGDGTLNLLLTWGSPRIVFCSHLDTVPPYIEPLFPDRWPVAAGHDERGPGRRPFDPFRRLFARHPRLDRGSHRPHLLRS